MITGLVESDGLPVIELPVGGRTWRATIDTGFNGDLELPFGLATSVNAQYFGRGRSILAGGQSIEEEHYLIEFPFDGRVVPALATFIDGNGILVGTRLLQDYRLEIDFVARTVVLERVG